jgi:hypothetical protein
MSLLLAGGAAPVAPSIIQGWFADAEDDWEFDEEVQAVFSVPEAPAIVFIDSFETTLTDDDDEDLPEDQQSQWIDFIQTIFRMPDEEVDEEEDLGDFSAFIPDSPVVAAEFVDSFRSEVEDDLDDEIEQFSFFIPDTPVVVATFDGAFTDDFIDDEEDNPDDYTSFIPDNPPVLEFVDSFHSAEDDDFYENDDGNDFEAISFPIEPDPTPPTPGIVYQTNMRQLGAMHEIDVKQMKMYRSMRMH